MSVANSARTDIRSEEEDERSVNAPLRVVVRLKIDGLRHDKGIMARGTIALGTVPRSACPHGVPSGVEGDITFLIQAVNNALNGCSA